MFETGKDYKHREIKEFFEVDKGSSILQGGKPKKFVALCLTKEYDFIEPNLLLIKNGSLIRKIGRNLANIKYPIKLFIKNQDDFCYKFVGDTTIIESQTAPRKLKSKLEQFKKINSKDISRIIYLKIPE
jgi:hypothetical protein